MKNLLYLFFILIWSCNEIPDSPIVDLKDNDLEITEDVPTLPTRPSGQIAMIQGSLCVCSRGEVKNTSVGCENTCSAQSQADPNKKLHLSFAVGPSLVSSEFQNLKGWCTKVLTDPETGQEVETGNPACTLEFTEKDTGVVSSVPINSQFITGNSIIVDNIGIEFNKRYGFTLKEQLSQLETEPLDIQVFSDLTNTLTDEPLNVEPIYQYACVNITTSTDSDTDGNGTVFYDEASKIHFYYDQLQKPEPSITIDNDNLICHQSENPVNNTPLIDNTPGQIKLWYKKEPRFADYVDPNTGITEVNTLAIDKIIQLLVEEYGQSLVNAPKLFQQFNFFTDPTMLAAGTQSLLGYYLIPFKDQTTQRHFCPGSEQYQSSDPIFRALGEILQQDTQAIYLAKQINTTSDFIFLSEEDAKAVWFYLDENNQEVVPTDESVSGKLIQFYWPLDKNNPLVRKNYQVVYTIQAPTSTNPANAPHDNRIGCVPKL